MINRTEQAVIHSICTQLENLGWVVNETDARNNVTQHRVKTLEQRRHLADANEGRPRFPDFVLYQEKSNNPIGIIEAKRPGESLDSALIQAEDRYAAPLKAPLIFAYDDTFVVTRMLSNRRSLKIDGEDVRQFVDHYTALRFINEGSEILSAPESVQLSREELIKVFKRQANLLREAGVQAGLDRFSVFSDILFLKLIDEMCQKREHAGEEAPISPLFRWSHFKNLPDTQKLEYVQGVVWEKMNENYNNIFGAEFPITSNVIFSDIVNGLSNLNFTAADTDVKGDAFEYFLKNAYQGINIKDLGEYFTPRNIVRTMVSMVDPKIGERIYDPFCGTGGFLIEAFRYVSLRTSPTPEFLETLRKKTVYGSEIGITSRVARMNMVLYGDGHSNVRHQDSFEKPVDEKYNVVLTNPPYSQETRYGNLYSISTKNGDAIAMQHCLRSLKDGGRAAILIKEDFLTKGGIVGKVRKLLLDSVNNISIVSLPRGLFTPYTPTKTSILYFEKSGGRRATFFFVVKNVGHTFGARQRSIEDNDLPNVLSAIRDADNAEQLPVDYHIEDKSTIVENSGSLWIYDYKESLPPQRNMAGNLEKLEKHIQRSGTKVSPLDTPDREFNVLGVSNSEGVFMNETKLGKELNGKRIEVQTNDFVYNPHRVNVGSIGVVPEHLSGGIISNVYIVFRLKSASHIPSHYLLYLLKSEDYLNIIRDYDTRHGAVRASLNWKQLQRIKLYVPSADYFESFTSSHTELENLRRQASNLESDLITQYFKC